MDAQQSTRKDFWEEYRPESRNLQKNLKKGDQVVVVKLDRLGRSLRHLVDLIALFNEKEVNFISLHDWH